jgi:hypothetical protein
MRVRAIYEWEIDPDAYVAAGIVAEYFPEGDDTARDYDLDEIAGVATGYCDAEDLLPRWARDSVRVISQVVEVVK